MESPLIPQLAPALWSITSPGVAQLLTSLLFQLLMLTFARWYQCPYRPTLTLTETASDSCQNHMTLRHNLGSTSFCKTHRLLTFDSHRFPTMATVPLCLQTPCAQNVTPYQAYIVHGADWRSISNDEKTNVQLRLRGTTRALRSATLTIMCSTIVMSTSSVMCTLRSRTWLSSSPMSSCSSSWLMLLWQQAGLGAASATHVESKWICGRRPTPKEARGQCYDPGHKHAGDCLLMNSLAWRFASLPDRPLRQKLRNCGPSVRTCRS
eukprot:932712-Amphidinium_carterae.2